MSCRVQDQAASSGNGAEFTVMIIASGPLRGGGLVHAVAVTQPVQSWTVLRSHDDFYAVSDVLSQLLPAVPPCPLISEGSGDLVSVVNARNELQKWLTAVLTHPGSTETLAVRNFLTYGANVILPQFEGVSWTSFNAEGAVISPPPQSTSATSTTSSGSVQQQQQQHVSNTASHDDGDMDMDIMFPDDDGAPEPHDDNDDYDDEYMRPSVRYKPTDEAITEEDEMEIMQFAGEVEMIEDIGSLAQSLGASHLGRSLQLQAEIATNENNQQENKMQKGLTLGGATSTTGEAATGGGGIGNAMASADGTNVAQLPSCFNHNPPESAPRLDSFKMIRVIGKGSFGGSCLLLWFFLLL